ncbi:MAG: hypothetical protein R2747_20430 [Pyrinomonadaceae bacterium]
MPSTTITGRIFFKPGFWGRRMPFRQTGRVTVWLMGRTAPILGASGPSDGDGWFKISFNLPATPATDMYIEVEDPCSGEKHMQPIKRPPKISPIPLMTDNIGEIEVPWEPADAELAMVNSKRIRGYRLLAKTLSLLLRSPGYPINISLRRQSLDGTGKDYTPAQLLLIPMKVDRPGFLNRVVGDVRDEVINTRSEKLNDLAVEILEQLSTVDLKRLEEGKLLNRFLAVIQRAFPSHSYSESLMTDPTHDMAAACVILFLAGLMKKDNVQPEIMFDSFKLGCDKGNARRTFSRVYISVNKN